MFVDSYSGCSKNEKQLNVPRENHFFEYVVFCVFESPDGPLGVILASLGVIWAKNGSHNGFQEFSEWLTAKLTKMMIKKCKIGQQFLAQDRLKMLSPG